MPKWSLPAQSELSGDQHTQWRDLIEQRTGICLPEHVNILQAALSQRMRATGLDDYQQYYQRLTDGLDSEKEWSKLIDRVTVQETSFFRDPQSFDTLRTFLLSRLGNHATQQLELWSVGCATGEEAYSLAITAADLLHYLAIDCPVRVTGSDISQAALNIAREGRYSERQLESLTTAMRSRFFKPLDQSSGLQRFYQANSELCQRLSFIRSNVLELGEQSIAVDSALQSLKDVIYCQNMLVYFNRQRQWQTLDMLINYLKPGGLLIIAPGEVVGWQNPAMQRLNREGVQAYIKAGA